MFRISKLGAASGKAKSQVFPKFYPKPSSSSIANNAKKDKSKPHPIRKHQKVEVKSELNKSISSINSFGGGPINLNINLANNKSSPKSQGSAGSPF
jgi:hypothetical protein